MVTIDQSNKFSLSKIISQNPHKLNSLSFSPNQLQIAVSNKIAITCYSIQTSARNYQIKDEAFGFRLLKWTHSPDKILTANSFGKQHHVTLSNITNSQNYYRYDNEKTPISSIDISPSSDTFLYSSLDGYVKLQDLRSQQQAGSIYIGISNYNCCKYFPDGRTIGVSFDDGIHSFMKFFDLRKTENEVGSQIQFQGSVREFQFSDDGSMYALALNGKVVVMHAYESQIIADCGEFGKNPLFKFTPDSKYLTVAEGNVLYVIDVSESVVVQDFRGNPFEINCLEWNLKHQLLAVGCKVLCLYSKYSISNPLN